MAGKQDPDGLNDQQLAFCEEYIVNFQSQQAALKAGYSEKSAAAQASQLLKNPKIQKHIASLLKKTGDERAILRERVIKELGLLAFSNWQDYVDGEGNLVPPAELSRAQLSAIAEQTITTKKSEDGSEVITVKRKLYSKDKALELLGRHLGIFTDKVQLKLPRPIVIERPDGGSVTLGAEMGEGEQDG